MAIPQKKTGAAVAAGKPAPGGKKPIKPGAAVEPTGGVSLRPKDAVAGGGLFDDFDGTIIDARFVEFDYDGTIDEPVLAICLQIQNDEEDENPEGERGKGQNPFLEHYSAGPITNFVPSDDGLQAIPAGSKTGLSDSCNAIQLLTSVVEAAADPAEMEERIGNSLEALHGMRAHFKRAQFKQRAGLDESDTKESGGKKFKKTGPLLIEMLLEGEAKKKAGTSKPAPNKTTPAKPAAKPAPAAAGKPAPKAKVEAPPAEEAEGVTTSEEYAIGYILEQLGANGGGVEKDALPKKVFKYAKDNGLANDVRNEILEYVGNEDWLNSQTEHFEFDGENLTAA